MSRVQLYNYRIKLILFLTLVIASFINCFFIKKKRLILVLPLAALVFAGTGALLEGYRIHVVPAYIITVILILVDMRKILSPEIKIHKPIRIILMIILIPVTIVAVTFPLLFPVVSLPRPAGEIVSCGRYFCWFTESGALLLLSNTKYPTYQLRAIVTEK